MFFFFPLQAKNETKKSSCVNSKSRWCFKTAPQGSCSSPDLADEEMGALDAKALPRSRLKRGCSAPPAELLGDRKHVGS